MPSKTSRSIHVHCAATVEDYVNITITNDVFALSMDEATESTSIQVSGIPFIQRIVGCVYLLLFGRVYSKTQITPATALALSDKLRAEAEGIIEMQLLRVDTELE